MATTVSFTSFKQHAGGALSAFVSWSGRTLSCMGTGLSNTASKVARIVGPHLSKLAGVWRANPYLMTGTLVATVLITVGLYSLFKRSKAPLEA